MSYLQVIGEQHLLVDQHMQRLSLPSSGKRPAGSHLAPDDPALLTARLQAAETSRVLDLRQLELRALVLQGLQLPDIQVGQQPAGRVASTTLLSHGS